MGKVVRLILPDFCKTEHRLYHAIGRACSICVPDPYARFCLWSQKYERWLPLVWAEDGYWDENKQVFIDGEGDAISIPAMYAGGRPFQGWGPGVGIVREEIPDDVYKELMEAQKIGSPPGSFERKWFEYEDKNKLMDS